jgi:cystathionine beta-lyase
LEAKLGSARVTAMIMCNPHNPTGQLWDAATLDRVHQLARANDVLIISDEVHCDLTDPGQQYTPYLVAAGAGPGAENAAVVEGAVMAASPSKAFNLAGLKCAALVVPEPGLRRQIARGLTRDELSMPNVFAFAAAVAAYDQSEYWLDQLREYVAINRQVATAEINRLIPEATVVESVATYLMWIDLRVWVGRSEAFAAAARRLTGIIVDPGAPFGPGGEGFVRLNLAAPRALVLDGINRLAQALEQGADSSW